MATITGTNLNDTLTGTADADVIDGGAGADQMTGGAGDDAYYVDNSADTVIELSGGGTDSVYSTVSYTLSNHIEKLMLLGTANLNATGNSLANVLIGNTGNNILNGGAGNDTMKGGAGNDTYHVNSSGDQVIESGLVSGSGLVLAGTDSITDCP